MPHRIRRWRAPGVAISLVPGDFDPLSLSLAVARPAKVSVVSIAASSSAWQSNSDLIRRLEGAYDEVSSGGFATRSTKLTGRTAVLQEPN